MGEDYGFLFNPNQLENEFGAVSSPLRTNAIFTTLEKEQRKIGADAQSQLITGGTPIGELTDIWRRTTDSTFDDLWDMESQTYSLKYADFKKETGIGLEWMLAEHRRLGITAEPEYITCLLYTSPSPRDS